MITIYAGNGVLDLGRAGENQVRRILFDLTPFAKTYGEGEALLFAQRADDNGHYPVLTALDDHYLVWTVSSADTAQSGFGSCELHWMVGEALAKSEIYSTHVSQSQGGDEVDPPDPGAPWYQQWAAKDAEQDEAISRLDSTKINYADAQSAARLYLAANQVDWGQYDASKPDYIKNRTHGPDLVAHEAWSGTMALTASGERYVLDIKLRFSNSLKDTVTANGFTSLRMSFWGQSGDIPVCASYVVGSGQEPWGTLSGRQFVIACDKKLAYDGTSWYYAAQIVSTNAAGWEAELAFVLPGIRQLDEQYIPAAIARTATTDDLAQRLAALEAGGGGGGGTSELIADVTLEESADLAIVNEDAAGVEFTLTRYRVFVLFPPTGYDTTAKYMINSNNTSIVAISTSAMAEYERGCYLYTDAAASEDYAEHYYTPVPVTWSDMGGNSGVLGWVKQLQAIYIIPGNTQYPVPKGTRVRIWGVRA